MLSNREPSEINHFTALTLKSSLRDSRSTKARTLESWLRRSWASCPRLLRWDPTCRLHGRRLSRLLRTYRNSSGTPISLESTHSNLSACTGSRALRSARDVAAFVDV